MDTPLLAAIPAGPVTPAVPTQPSLMPAPTDVSAPTDIPNSPLATTPATSALTPTPAPLVKPKNPTFGMRLHAALMSNPLTFKNPLANVAVAGIDALSGVTSALSNVAASPDSGMGVLAQTAKNIEAQKVAKAQAAAKAQQQALENATKADRDAHLNALTTAQTFSAYSTAQRLDEDEQRAMVTDGQKAGAAYAQTHDKVNSEPITDLNAAIANKIYDPAKMVAYPSGLTSVPDSKGTPQEVVTYDLYKADDRPVPITPEVRAFMKEFGQDPGAVTEIPGTAFNNLQAQASQASAAQKLLFGMKDDSMTQALKLEKDQGSLQFNQDTALVNPYLAAHVSKYGNDPISAMAHLSTQIDPATGQPTPQAAAAQRIMQGPVGEKDQADWQKLLETHRHNLADEAAAREKNAIESQKEKVAKGQTLGDANLSGPAYLASLPPAEQQLVQQIHDGNFILTRWDYPIARGSAIAQELALAFPNDPDKFDSGLAAQFPKLQSEFHSGKVGKSLNSASASITHLARLHDLDTLSSRLPGGISENSADWQDVMKTLPSELANFYGETMTEGNIKEKKDALTPMFNRRAAIRQQMDLMVNKLAAYADQWKEGLPSKAYAKTHPMPGIDEQAKEALAYYEPDFINQYPQFAPTRLPARAVQQLQDGHNTQFANGSVWTLKGGLPFQVKPAPGQSGAVTQ